MIDDTWQNRRYTDGSLGPNQRFGDMKSLIDYVHSAGLKMGIYSSPNAETCSGFVGVSYDVSRFFCSAFAHG